MVCRIWSPSDSICQILCDQDPRVQEGQRSGAPYELRVVAAPCGPAPGLALRYIDARRCCVRPRPCARDSFGATFGFPSRHWISQVSLGSLRRIRISHAGVVSPTYTLDLPSRPRISNACVGSSRYIGFRSPKQAVDLSSMPQVFQAVRGSPKQALDLPSRPCISQARSGSSM
jgi:hypothetical protein